MPKLQPEKGSNDRREFDGLLATYLEQASYQALQWVGRFGVLPLGERQECQEAFDAILEDATCKKLAAIPKYLRKSLEVPMWMISQLKDKKPLSWEQIILYLWSSDGSFKRPEAAGWIAKRVFPDAAMLRIHEGKIVAVVDVIDLLMAPPGAIANCSFSGSEAGGAIYERLFAGGQGQSKRPRQSQCRLVGCGHIRPTYFRRRYRAVLRSKR